MMTKDELLALALRAARSREDIDRDMAAAREAAAAAR